jgi:hypothetical protein
LRTSFAKWFVATSILIVCSPSSAYPSEQDDTGAAYHAALKCFAANTEASAERRDAGDQAGADRYNASGQQAFNGAVKLGGMLGLTNRQINRDFEALQTTEMPRMIKDRQYFIGVVSECKGLGLMG